MRKEICNKLLISDLEKLFSGAETNGGKTSKLCIEVNGSECVYTVEGFEDVALLRYFCQSAKHDGKAVGASKEEIIEIAFTRIGALLKSAVDVLKEELGDE